MVIFCTRLRTASPKSSNAPSLGVPNVTGWAGSVAKLKARGTAMPLAPARSVSKRSGTDGAKYYENVQWRKRRQSLRLQHQKEDHRHHLSWWPEAAISNSTNGFTSWAKANPLRRAKPF